ncbi:hypothetical protein [Limosilactobacillus fermentum]|uniref:hypothetical protein n=1 Tax=Limosilactobacillus fermentum TaxID=1613 RepID=UPI00065268AB|nr:hypothetical protein [Limosilactobacillus fermentum]
MTNRKNSKMPFILVVISISCPFIILNLGKLSIANQTFKPEGRLSNEMKSYSCQQVADDNDIRNPEQMKVHAAITFIMLISFRQASSG